MATLGLVALAAAALFTGAAAYINLAEQPARLTLDDRALLTEWKPAYQQGLRMQVTLLIAGFLCGMGQWWAAGGPLWLVGAVVLVANLPYTVVVILPVNRLLEATANEDASPATRTLIERWGRLHAGRSVLGAVATILLLLAAAQPG